MKGMTEDDYLTIDLKDINKNTKEKHSGEACVAKDETLKELFLENLMDLNDFEDGEEDIMDVAVQYTTFVVDGEAVSGEKKIGEVCKCGSKVKMTTAKFKIHGMMSVDVPDSMTEAASTPKFQEEAKHSMPPRGDVPKAELVQAIGAITDMNPQWFEELGKAGRNGLIALLNCCKKMQAKIEELQASINK